MNRKFQCKRCFRMILATDDNLEYPFICRSCLEYWQYAKNHPVQKTIDESHYRFTFEQGLTYNFYKNEGLGFVYGRYVNESDRIDVFLFAIKDRMDLPKVVADLISHEETHRCLFHLEGNETSTKYDSIAQKLESWLGISFRNGDN